MTDLTNEWFFDGSFNQCIVISRSQCPDKKRRTLFNTSSYNANITKLNKAIDLKPTTT